MPALQQLQPVQRPAVFGNPTCNRLLPPPFRIFERYAALLFSRLFWRITFRDPLLFLWNYEKFEFAGLKEFFFYYFLLYVISHYKWIFMLCDSFLFKRLITFHWEFWKNFYYFMEWINEFFAILYFSALLWKIDASHFVIQYWEVVFGLKEF